ncbi:hypothetical protein WA158_004662 [Blastocystis sp. Blastoise]
MAKKINQITAVNNVVKIFKSTDLKTMSSEYLQTQLNSISVDEIPTDPSIIKKDYQEFISLMINKYLDLTMENRVICMNYIYSIKETKLMSCILTNPSLIGKVIRNLDSKQPKELLEIQRLFTIYIIEHTTYRVLASQFNMNSQLVMEKYVYFNEFLILMQFFIQKNIFVNPGSSITIYTLLNQLNDIYKENEHKDCKAILDLIQEIPQNIKDIQDPKSPIFKYIPPSSPVEKSTVTESEISSTLYSVNQLPSLSSLYNTSSLYTSIDESIQSIDTMEQLSNSTGNTISSLVSSFTSFETIVFNSINSISEVILHSISIENDNEEEEIMNLYNTTILTASPFSLTTILNGISNYIERIQLLKRNLQEKLRLTESQLQTEQEKNFELSNQIEQLQMKNEELQQMLTEEQEKNQKNTKTIFNNDIENAHLKELLVKEQDYANTQQSIIDEKDQEIVNLNSTLINKEQYIDELNQYIDSLVNENNNITLVKNQYIQLNDTQTSTIMELTTEINELTKQLEECNNDNNQFKELLSKQYLIQSQDYKMKIHDLEVKDLENGNMIVQMQREIDTITRDIEKCQMALNTTINDYTDQIEGIESKANKEKKEIEELYITKLNHTYANYSSIILKMTESYNMNITTLTSHYNTLISTMKEDYLNQISTQQEQYKEKYNQLYDLLQNYEEKYKMIYNHIEEMKSNRYEQLKSQDIEKLESMLVSHKDYCISLETEYDNKLKSIQEHYSLLIQQEQQKCQDTISSLEKKCSTLDITSIPIEETKESSISNESKEDSDDEINQKEENNHISQE